jgi:hypothetical protein
MDHNTVLAQHAADGTSSALAADALNAAERKQEMPGRLATQFIQLSPHHYCPACFDDPHAATCPNLTRTGQA